VYSSKEANSRGCCCFVVANGGGACGDYFKILHLTTMSVAEIMQGVASVMAGWLDQWMPE
jgi:hypothetical protein